MDESFFSNIKKEITEEPKGPPPEMQGAIGEAGDLPLVLNENGEKVCGHSTFAPFFLL